jgi:hypothetical protein
MGFNGGGDAITAAALADAAGFARLARKAMIFFHPRDTACHIVLT